MEVFESKGIPTDIGALEKKYPIRRQGETELHMRAALHAGGWLVEREFDVRFRDGFSLHGGGRLYVDIYGRSLVRRTNVVMEVKISQSDYLLSLPKYRRYIHHYKGVCWSPFAEHFFLVVLLGIPLRKRIPKRWGLLEYDDEKKSMAVISMPTRVECRPLRHGPSVDWIPERL